jgi:hypothetical protein
MATTLEVQYYNSFWMKNLNDLNGNSVWPKGYPYQVAGAFPGTAVDQTNGFTNNWQIEESRIRGGYNNTQVDLGVKAYIVEDEPNQQHRSNSLIYSGIFNSRTGINQTNQFSVAEDITRSIDPVNGSIQKLYAEDTNLLIFQEKKVSYSLIDKDAIYTAEGQAITTTGNQVIGQNKAYLGEWGISTDPLSFAIYGYQKYFTDANKGVVLRLSRDGITEISSYGMIDYFRDTFSSINEFSTYGFSTNLAGQGIPSADWSYRFNIGFADQALVNDIQLGMAISTNGVFAGYVVLINYASRIITVDRAVTISLGNTVRFYTPIKNHVIGGYDIHNKNYILSLQNYPEWIESTGYNTLAFDELVNGWSSFYDFKPGLIFSLQSNTYTTHAGKLYKHYSESGGLNRGYFYGVRYNSTITFVFNPESSKSKVFQTVNYEGDNGWQVNSFVSDLQQQDQGYTGMPSWNSYQDITAQIPSYIDGRYEDTSSGRIVVQRRGFERKENKYFANLINSSTVRLGEVVYGNLISGIKGYFATVTFSTDNTTQAGGAKELWSVGTKFVRNAY